MPATSSSPPNANKNNVPVFCVDDNLQVADALRIKLSRVGGFTWKGWASDADSLRSLLHDIVFAIVILDLDMPGRDPLDVTRELQVQYPEIRVVIFSGHVRKELIDEAVMAGAWGYVSKSDGEQALIDALHMVAEGEFAFSPEVWTAFER